MADDPIVLDGFLDDMTPPDTDDAHTTVNFLLVVSPTEERVDELVLPCTVADSALAHTVLHVLTDTDLLRVTGYLQLPQDPADGLRLYVSDIHNLEDGVDLDHVDTDRQLNLEELPPHGRIETRGDYQIWHNPDTGRSSIWHTSGAWAGDTDDPATLIGRNERGAPTAPPRRRWRARLPRIRPWPRRA